jgi:glutamate racemase
MIGIFDSGSGGLTVLKAIRAVLPSSDILYFGDIKNAPYGSRPRDELSALTVHAIQLLKGNGADRIVSACNSVSASLAISLFDALAILPNDLIEMVGPTVAYFRNTNKRILLVATQATIQSGIYQNAFTMIGKNITAIAIPELAGMIEFGKGEAEMRIKIRDAFSTIDLKNFDVLILACTHYPLRLDLFREAMPKTMIIFDPAIAVAERVEKQFWPMEAGNRKMTFLISEESMQFRSLVQNLFPNAAYRIDVV